MQFLIYPGGLQMFFTRLSALSIAFLSSKHKEKPQSSSKNGLRQEETTLSTILCTVHSSTHSNLDSANVSGHDMQSFQTITHSLPTKSMSRPEASILMMFFYVNLTVNKSLLIVIIKHSVMCLGPQCEHSSAKIQ